MAAYWVGAFLAPVSFAQSDSITYSIAVGGEVGVIQGRIGVFAPLGGEGAGTSICVRIAGEMGHSSLPFRLDFSLGFGEMFVGPTPIYDHGSPSNYFVQSRLGISTYFNRGLRMYAALTLMKPFKDEVLLNSWPGFFTTRSFWNAVFFEFGLRVRIAMFQLEPLFRSTFNNSIDRWSGGESRCAEWAVGFSYVFGM